MIYFHCEDCTYNLRDKNKMRSWLTNLIQSEGLVLGEVNIIFTSDPYLLAMNKQYLQHDYYTDVITFDYSENKLISGDVFISIDMVRTNAKTFKNRYLDEVWRVCAHGVLHLCGYVDKETEDKVLMTSKEDYYLSLRNV